jgi:hypothetical protein
MLFRMVLLGTLVAMIVLTLFAARSDAAISKTQKLQKSQSVVSWYENSGRWTLRPRYQFCADLRSARAAGRCWRHRENLRWHRARVARLTPKPVLGHVQGWLCIHSKEGAWDAQTGNGYYGGLQMSYGWAGRVTNAALLSAAQQIAEAEAEAAEHGWSYDWMRGQWPNTFPPCSGYF